MFKTRQKFKHTMHKQAHLNSIDSVSLDFVFALLLRECAQLDNAFRTWIRSGTKTDMALDNHSRTSVMSSNKCRNLPCGVAR